MAVSLNKVVFIGNLCSDANIRTTAEDETFGGFYLVTKESWIDSGSGELREKSEKHRVSIIDSRLANSIGSGAKRGALAYVEGTVQTKELTDRQGHKRFVTEVVAGFRGKVAILAPVGNVGHVNKVTLIGNMGKDPGVRTIGSGKTFADFSLATSESWKDKATGEWRDRTEWHKVSIVVPQLAERIGRDGAKGRSVYVEGMLQTRKYTDAQGVEKSATEVVVGFTGVTQFFDKKAGSDSGPNAARPNGGEQQRGSGRVLERAFAGDLDDEVPF